jgi:hypothetical protein
MTTRFGLYLCLVLILASLVYAQKATQPVTVVNTPNVTVSNSSLPVTGSVTVNNSSIPVSGAVQVSNLPLDSNGNLKTVVSPIPVTRHEFKILTYHFCSTPPDAGICYNGEQNADFNLTDVSTAGWELISVVPYTKLAFITSNGYPVMEGGMAFTFRRPLP